MLVAGPRELVAFSGRIRRAWMFSGLSCHHIGVRGVIVRSHEPPIATRLGR
jgi:hypothetical protein